MKKDSKLRLLLQELNENPYRQLNLAFLLISIIPILTLIYIIYSNNFTAETSVADLTRICILAGVIILLGYTIGYKVLEEIINKILSYATRAKKADELKSKFAMSLAHDLKSPLSAIKADIAGLRAGYHGDLTAKQKECILSCDSVTDRMNSIIMELIDTYKYEARIAKLNLSLFDLRDIVDEQKRELEAIAVSKNITLLIEPSKKELAVHADREKMVRAINNLLNNSIKYTPPGGKVIIRMLPEPGFARMEFLNTGTPIAENMLEKIFDKFERLDASVEGHGLGLAIAKDIIELHNGRVWATSGPRKPNCFTILAPLAQKERHVHTNNNKILIIEDDKNFASALANMVIANGYEALVNNDAAGGLKSAQTENPSLIILDLSLPGVDDYFVLKNLRQIDATRNIPVIISTGNVEDDLEKKVRDMGADDFIQKPYAPEKLLSKVKTFLPK
ncbi:MAG: ATP-binding protein [Candidatus Omnitrophota bacterium]